MRFASCRALLGDVAPLHHPRRAGVQDLAACPKSRRPESLLHDIVGSTDCVEARRVLVVRRLEEGRVPPPVRGSRAVPSACPPDSAADASAALAACSLVT